MQELDLQIQYRTGKHNANADALSCFPLSVAVVSSLQNVDRHQCSSKERGAQPYFDREAVSRP